VDKEQEMIRRLESIKNLPTLPVVIDRLSAAIRDPNSDGKRIAKIIEDDPAIMTRTLKVVNSAFYAGKEPITSLQMAVARLGMTAIRNIAMSTSVFSTFAKGTESGLNREEFWRHSICSGIAAGVIADSARDRLSHRYSRDSLHLAGLLHDIGKIFYDQFFHDEFGEALRLATLEQKPLYESEKAVLGMDHAQAGMWLAVKWTLGVDLTQVVYWHHEPDRAEEANREFVALVHTANYICNIEKIGNGGDPSPTYIPGVWKRLGLSIGDISGIVDKIHVESARSEILMSLV
jgi:HD-like signal output (HDOD) protein